MIHKLYTLFYKVRKYGIHGTYTAVARIFQRDTPLHLAMLRMAAHQTTKPKHGITIIGDMTTHASLPKVLCDLHQKLQECGIPCQCLDTKKPLDENFEILKYDHIIALLPNPLPKKLRKRVNTGVIAFWEFDSGILNGYPQLLDGDTIIGMSEFNYQYYKKALPHETVKRILYPFQLPSFNFSDENRNLIRDKFNIPRDAFMVFFNFGLGSKRKNPEAIISAFSKAFSNDDNVILVFKTMFSKRFPECLSALHNQARELHIERRFLTIDTYLEEEEMYALTNACDVYISLHRGEGFGLGIAEAMQFGKPVIVTDWSASTEFCNRENSIPIPFQYAPIDPSEFKLLPYEGVTRWAEPDIDAAAKALRQLYDNPTLRSQLGENGRRFIEEHYSAAEFKKSIDTFLDA